MHIYTQLSLADPIGCVPILGVLDDKFLTMPPVTFCSPNTLSNFEYQQCWDI